MTEQRVKVYFLGSGMISVPILEGLLHSEMVEVVGIGSQAKSSKKKKSGPQRTMTTHLIQFCEEHGLAVDKLATVNTEDFHSHFTETGAEMLVVASFGQILKQQLLDLPKYHCLNVHASLLPKYRGASPVSAALLNGDTTTGVAFMDMEAGLDTGGVYRTLECPIDKADTTDSLMLKLGKLAGEQIGQVIHDMVYGGLKPTPQPEEGVSYVGKISKDDGIVDWGKSAFQIANMVRAYSPWPSVRAWIPSYVGNKSDTIVVKGIKITQVTELELTCSGSCPGDILAYGRQGIVIACGEGALRIEKLIPEGRKEMQAKEFILGSRIAGDNPRMCNPEVEH